MEEKKDVKKDIAQTAIMFASGAGGVVGGAFGLKQLDKILPSTLPALVKKIGPGLATMVVAYLAATKVDDKKAKALLLGLGAGGVLDIVRKLLGDKVKFVSDNVPQLSGGGPGSAAAINYGDFPPSYYKENAFQGVPVQGVPVQGMGNTAYQLSGMGNTAYALSGTPTGYSLGMGERALMN